MNQSDPANLSSIPVVPLKEMVVYPHGVHPLFVGTERSIAALQSAMSGDKQVLLVAKRNADIEEPKQEDLYSVGTLSTILQLLNLPDGTVKVLVEGEERARIDAFHREDDFGIADITILQNIELEDSAKDLINRTVMEKFQDYVRYSKKDAEDAVSSITSIDDPSRLIDTITSQLELKLEDKQSVLEAGDIEARMALLLDIFEAALNVRKLEKRIKGRVKDQVEKSQRQWYLNEQMRAIQKELGQGDESADELDTLATGIQKAGMPKDAKSKALSELSKLRSMAPMSAEATVVRSYLEWILSIPWKTKTRTRKDLRQAQKVLDSDHFGLQDIKDRILEFLAVHNRVGKIKGSVLCLMGPPGVGKTSLGESIARATNRKYVRIALGGVRDEAEIRGHRRTYIGSMPGKILQKMAKSGVKNPLFLLDEVDKVGMDYRGDPASALLEVLDPEQNDKFNDHYLELDYDLSDVFFICTSNTMNIPAALLDRMEVIRLPGYTEDEKINIASKFLIPKQKKQSGIGKKEVLDLDNEAITEIIRHYTKEAGVRGLEREIAKICRKVVTMQSLEGFENSGTIGSADIEKYCGVRKFDYGKAISENRVGSVTGLAWTQVGGELLNIESVVVPGTGKIIKTGSLGEVMQESIQAALTVVRSRCESLGISGDFYEKQDIHVHVPEGATPKDGPSAGIGMCTAMVSVLTDICVRSDVAMTGEITLRGQVLPIGGVKEKLLAAHRGGIKKVVIPKENERDLADVPENIKSDMEIYPVSWIDEVFQYALEDIPRPNSSPSSRDKESKNKSLNIKTH